MATSMFYSWDSLGRPLTPAQPIREIVEAFKARYPATASQFSWYADEAHYQDNFPEDHTPFSMTGYPNVNPHWWVCATDIMSAAVGGTDEAQRQFDYWLAEAKAGRMPWLKYLIWESKLYDVRNDWRPVANSGHFDHIHMSTRTDFLHTGLGNWDPFGVDMPLTDEDVEKIWAKRALDNSLGVNPDSTMRDLEVDASAYSHQSRDNSLAIIDLLNQIKGLIEGLTPPADGLVAHTHQGGETGPAIPTSPTV